MLVKFKLGYQKLVVEKWKIGAALPRSGATATRSSSIVEPKRDQLIIIQRDGTANPANPASFTVNGGNLVLEFNNIFLREARPEVGEEDVILDVFILQKWAVNVWKQYLPPDPAH